MDELEVNAADGSEYYVEDEELENEVKSSVIMKEYLQQIGIHNEIKKIELMQGEEPVHQVYAFQLLNVENPINKVSPSTIH